MTRLIAIETTSRRGQAALAVDGAIVRQVDLPHGPRHAAALVAEVAALCEAEGWPPREVGCVAVSVGPGSFTGTRVGVTFAKTFAFAVGASVVAVPTAAVVAANAEERDVCVVFDARRGSVWAERFREGETVERFGVLAPAELLARLPRPITLIGEGLAYHAKAFAEAGADVRILSEERVWPRVEVVARLAEPMRRAGNVADARALTPTYVRRPEAEEQRLMAAAAAASA